ACRRRRWGSAASSARSRRACAPTWCCGAATRWNCPACPTRCGSTAARSRCGPARPSCATATWASFVEAEVAHGLAVAPDQPQRLDPRLDVRFHERGADLRVARLGLDAL